MTHAGTFKSVKINGVEYPFAKFSFKETRAPASLEGFGGHQPITMSTSVKVTRQDAKRLQRLASGRHLPLKQRKRRRRNNRLAVTITGRWVGRISGRKLLYLMRNNHRKWMIMGRVMCERDYREAK